MSGTIISKGRIEARAKCPRKYYYSYHYKGGWSEEGSSRDLQIGIWVHLGLESLLRSDDINVAMAVMAGQAPPDGASPEDKEHFQLARGLVLGWYRARWEVFKQTYRIISIENEVLLPLAVGLELLGRCDVVVEEILTGDIYVINWKTSNDQRDWTDKWKWDIQMWTEALATEKELGVSIRGCIVEGLYKGQWKKGRGDDSPHWTSPLIFGFRGGKSADGAPKFKEKSVPGWDKVPMWENQFGDKLPIGADPLGAWIGLLPKDTLEDQFMQSLPILRNDAVVEEWLEGVVRREEDARSILETGTERDHLSYFTQSFGKWNCSMCTFESVCLKSATIESLVDDHRLVPRRSPITEMERARVLEGGNA